MDPAKLAIIKPELAMAAAGGGEVHLSAQAEKSGITTGLISGEGNVDLGTPGLLSELDGRVAGAIHRGIHGDVVLEVLPGLRFHHGRGSVGHVECAGKLRCF